jgi:hypothetical protein
MELIVGADSTKNLIGNFRDSYDLNFNDVIVTVIA